MRIYLPFYLKPKTDLNRTSGKNPINGLIRPAQELAKLVTKTSTKKQEPKTYDKVINNPIYDNRWKKTVDKEL